MLFSHKTEKSNDIFFFEQWQSSIELIIYDKPFIY